MEYVGFHSGLQLTYQVFRLESNRRLRTQDYRNHLLHCLVSSLYSESFQYDAQIPPKVQLLTP